MTEENKDTEPKKKEARPFVGKQNDIDALEAEVAEAERQRRIDAGLEEPEKEPEPEPEPTDPDVRPTEPEPEPEKKVAKKEEGDPENAEEKTWKERYANLRSYSDKTMNELKARVDSLQNQLNEAARDGMKMPKSEEEIQAFAKKHPEAWAVIQSIAMQSVKGVTETTNKRIEAAERKMAEAEREKALNLIEKKHPDFQELAQSSDFHEWAKKQPQWIWDALYKNSTDALSCIRAIDLYKMDAGMLEAEQAADKKKKEAPANRKESAAEATDNTRGTSPSVRDKPEYEFKESEIELMSGAEFEKNFEAIEKAQKEGRVLYDLTGAAQ